MNLLKLLNIYRNFLSITADRIERAEISLMCDSKSVTFPIVPSDLPEIKCEQKNQIFESVIGDVSSIGLLGLREISFDKLLCPSDNNKYPFARGSSGDEIINFINNSRLQGEPFRLVITRGSNTYLNMLAVIDDFSYYLDNVNDYYVSIDFKEYRYYDATTGSLQS